MIPQGFSSIPNPMYAQSMLCFSIFYFNHCAYMLSCWCNCNHTVAGNSFVNMPASPPPALTPPPWSAKRLGWYQCDNAAEILACNVFNVLKFLGYHGAELVCIMPLKSYTLYFFMTNSSNTQILIVVFVPTITTIKKRSFQTLTPCLM